MITILIPTTPERRERLQNTIESIREHTTQPYKLTIYENNYEGYVKAIHTLLDGIDGLVWCLNDDVILKNDTSINLLSSSSQIWQPSPFFINNGAPSTDLNARTGEFTPPGKYVLAVSNKDSDSLLFKVCFVAIFEVFLF